jgi:hypothetical protein
MEQKQKLFKWLSVIFLAVGFLTYVAYLFCRKPAGMSGGDYDHIGWFVVDVFMIGGALLGLLWPAKFEKLAGFCIVGLSFANLVMNAVEDTGSILYATNPNLKGDPVVFWMQFFEGLVSIIAIVAIIMALAFPKAAKILGPVAVFAFIALGLLILAEGIYAFTPAGTGAAYPRPWAWGVNLTAVALIILGLAFGLMRYSYLLKPDFEAKE